jgi:hypothetical protein
MIKKTEEKTVYRALSLSSYIGGGIPTAVDIKNDKIVRIRPMHYDLKYAPEQINAWKYSRNDKIYKPIMKSLLI